MDIEIKHVSVSFPAGHSWSRVLRDASLRLKQGRITALVGESGSGKSILGAAMMQLLPPEAKVEGEISLEGRDLLSLSEKEMEALRGRDIGWIAQDPISAMDPLFPVGKQVAEAMHYDTPRSKEEEKAGAIRQLARFGLADAAAVYQRKPHELSGGMAQRVMAAMMAMPRPAWIIADEPTKGLDAFVRREVCEVFRQLREEGVGFLLITHDLRLAERLSDDTAIIYGGEIIEMGETKDIFSRPLHPYTMSFLDAQPRRSLRPIPGIPPNLSDIPKGCIFKERCPYGKDCSGDAGEFSLGTHWVKCRKAR